MLHYSRRALEFHILICIIDLGQGQYLQKVLQYLLQVIKSQKVHIYFQYTSSIFLKMNKIMLFANSYHVNKHVGEKYLIF